jgi:beta-lactamase regulating signal transducer with metallopeptidase domain
MDTLLQIGLSNAVVATALALVVACVGLLWRRPALVHSLWLLVLLKLITPPLFWVPVPWPPTPTAHAAAAEASAAPEQTASVILDGFNPDDWPVADGVDGETDDPAMTFRLGATGTDISDPAANAEATASPTWLALWWQSLICGVWLAGSVFWYACAYRRLASFQRLLRHARLAPVQMQKQTERLARKLGMSWVPMVYLVPGRVAPLLWAFLGRPRLVLPADLLEQVDSEQRATLILHELAHLRRRDHWVRALEFAAMGLYWWHPIVWFVRRELREAEELCCDAWVVASLPEANRTYATALVETIDFLSAVRSPVPLLASGVGPISDLKTRLTMIMRGKTPRKLSWCGLILVCGLGALLLPLLPSFAEAEMAKTDGLVAEMIDERARWDGVIEAGALDTVPADLEALEISLKAKEDEIHATEAKIRAIRKKLELPEITFAKPLDMPSAFRLLFRSQKGEPQEIILRHIEGNWRVVDPRSPDAAKLNPITLRLGDETKAPQGGAARPVAMGSKGAVSTQTRGRTAGQQTEPNPERRIDALEKKLDQATQLIEKMQRAMKDRQRQATNSMSSSPAQNGSRDQGLKVASKLSVMPGGSALPQ